MISLLAILAQTLPATTQAVGAAAQGGDLPAPPTPPPQPWWAQFFQNPYWMMALLLLVFYIFMIRNKRTQERQRESMLKQLKRNDRIQTIGGIIGTVIEAKDHEVLVKVDETSNTKIRFARSAIHRVLESEGRPQTK